MHDFVQVITTIDSKEGAAAIAHRLVEARLAACVQVSGPISSTYRWQDDVATDQEWYCVAKTTTAAAAAVERAIAANHPYDEPEIVVVPIVGGSAGYLRWLSEAVRPER